MSETSRKIKSCPYDPRTVKGYLDFLQVMEYYIADNDMERVKHAFAVRRAKIDSTFGLIIDNIKCPAPKNSVQCKTCPLCK